ncbi:hypothetical protein ACC734_40350, partial [Rhizobium ruizarguesonis]
VCVQQSMLPGCAILFCGVIHIASKDHLRHAHAPASSWRRTAGVSKNGAGRRAASSNGNDACQRLDQSAHDDAA